MTTSITERRVDINALRAFTLHTILALTERHDLAVPLRIDGRDHAWGPCLWLHFDTDDAIRGWAKVLGVPINTFEDDDREPYLEASAVGRGIWLGWSQVHLVAYVHDRPGAPIVQPGAASVLNDRPLQTIAQAEAASPLNDRPDRGVCRYCAATIEDGGGAWLHHHTGSAFCGPEVGGVARVHKPITADAPAVAPMRGGAA